jgi:hypothetical protein
VAQGLGVELKFSDLENVRFTPAMKMLSRELSVGGVYLDLQNSLEPLSSTSYCKETLLQRREIK